MFRSPTYQSQLKVVVVETEDFMQARRRRHGEPFAFLQP
jgi:hypothetical protein